MELDDIEKQIKALKRKRKELLDGKNTKYLLIYPVSMHEDVEERSKEKGVFMAEFIREAIQEKLDR